MGPLEKHKCQGPVQLDFNFNFNPDFNQVWFFFFLNCFYSWNTGFGIAGLPPQPTSRYIPQYAAVV